jgi:hypothetical protein
MPTNVPNVPNNALLPYKDIQFEFFLKVISSLYFQNWSILAQALGVNRRTILRWRRHPLARQATIAGIIYCLNKMQEVGANDWKMYRERLRMLGMKSA